MAKSFNTFIIALFFVLFLGGCAQSKKSVKLDESMVKMLRSEVKVYDQSELSMSKFDIIEPLQATSCMNKPWESAASQENGIDQLRYKAYLKGANALFKVFCEPKVHMNVQADCINSVTCYGVAIKVIRKY